MAVYALSRSPLKSKHILSTLPSFPTLLPPYLFCPELLPTIKAEFELTAHLCLPRYSTTIWSPSTASTVTVLLAIFLRTILYLINSSPTQRALILSF